MTSTTAKLVAMAVSSLLPCACGSNPYSGFTFQGDASASSTVSDFYISIAPVRQLDLVFMLDNSPGMAAKIEKMLAGFF